MTPPRRSTNNEYVITLRGVAGPEVLAAFGEYTLTVAGDETVMQGRMEDQAALHGLLQRIQDLGMEILEIRYATDPGG